MPPLNPPPSTPTLNGTPGRTKSLPPCLILCTAMTPLAPLPSQAKGIRLRGSKIISMANLEPHGIPSVACQASIRAWDIFTGFLQKSIVLIIGRFRQEPEPIPRDSLAAFRCLSYSDSPGMMACKPPHVEAAPNSPGIAIGASSFPPTSRVSSTPGTLLTDLNKEPIMPRNQFLPSSFCSSGATVTDWEACSNFCRASSWERLTRSS